MYTHTHDVSYAIEDFSTTVMYQLNPRRLGERKMLKKTVSALEGSSKSIKNKKIDK